MVVHIDLTDGELSRVKLRAKSEKRSIGAEARYLIERGFETVSREAILLESIRSGATQLDKSAAGQ